MIARRALAAFSVSLALGALAAIGGSLAGCERKPRQRPARVDPPPKRATPPRQAHPPSAKKRHPTHEHEHGAHPHGAHAHHHHPHPHPHLDSGDGHHHPY